MSKCRKRAGIDTGSPSCTFRSQHGFFEAKTQEQEEQQEEEGGGGAPKSALTSPTQPDIRIFIQKGKFSTHVRYTARRVAATSLVEYGLAIHTA